MASVRIDFEQPTDEGLVALRIFEAPAANGPFTQIQRVTVIGAYPEYISYFTTAAAVNPNAWFTIQWEDAGGALSAMSNPFQGGTTSLIGDLVERVRQRDPSIKEVIARQEVEALLEAYFNKDPYTVTLDGNPRKYRILNGVTLMALARSYISTFSTGGEYDKWTAGLVSVQSGKNASISFRDVARLFQEGIGLMGYNRATVARMVGLPIAGGVSERISEDTTRLLLSVV